MTPAVHRDGTAPSKQPCRRYAGPLAGLHTALATMSVEFLPLSLGHRAAPLPLRNMWPNVAKLSSSMHYLSLERRKKCANLVDPKECYKNIRQPGSSASYGGKADDLAEAPSRSL